MYSTYLSAAAEIAREAGALLIRFFERRVAVEYKGDYDVVTEADRASESLIVERLRARYPSHTPSWPRRVPGSRTPPTSSGTSIPWTAPPTSLTAFPCSP